MRTTETGHVRNVINFATLVSTCEAFGDSYRPSRPSLKLDALRRLRDESQSALDAYLAANADWSVAVADRADAFAKFGAKITRIFNAIKASDSTERLDERIGLLVRRLRGSRRKYASHAQTDSHAHSEGPAAAPRRQNSVSHGSFSDRLVELDQLIQFIGTIPHYAPNEEELSLASLESWRQELAAKSQAVTDRHFALTAARATRDKLLYENVNGLVSTASDTKAYLRSVHGATSPEIKQIVALPFRATV